MTQDETPSVVALPGRSSGRGGASASQGGAYAALDLGTNNCRLLVAAPVGDGFRVIDSFSRTVRLGEGLHDSGRLSDAAMERAMAALHTCASRIEVNRAGKVGSDRPGMARSGHKPLLGMRAIATEACRRATNGAEFLARVKAETGIGFDIISTREEAELALESCAPLLGGGARRAILFDIGGGSTELAWVRIEDAAPPQLIGYASLPVGVVTLAERFGAASFTGAGFEAMVDDVTARLTAFEAVHCIGQEIRCGGVQLLGTSGTVTTLAGIALGLPRYRRPLVDGQVLTGATALQALATLREMGRDGLLRHPCVGPDRVEFVLPGCAVFAAIIRLWPAERVVVADRGLREGMLLRMMRANRPRGHRVKPNGTVPDMPDASAAGGFRRK